MCYHTALTARPRQLALRFGRAYDRIRDFRPVYRLSAFDRVPCPAVTSDPELRYFTWGLIPSWVGSEEEALAIRNRTANARSETVFTRPAFREPIRRRRCLIPASGFYEWRHEGRRKTPYFLALAQEPLFALAGVYDCWQHPATGQVLATYSILTTEANDLLREIHNTKLRMPVILDPDDEARWLDPAASPSALAALLRPYPADAMTARPVRSDFLRRSPYDPDVLSVYDPTP